MSSTLHRRRGDCSTLAFGSRFSLIAAKNLAVTRSPIPFIDTGHTGQVDLLLLSVH